MFKLVKDIKTKKLLCAISSTDKKAKGKEEFSTFVDKNTTYFVMKKKTNLSDLLWKLREVFSKLDSDTSVDLRTFGQLLDEKYRIGFLTQAILIHELVNETPFCLKTKKDKVEPSFVFCDYHYNLLNKQIKVLAEAFNFARKLELMPSNYLNPKKFVDEVKKQFAPFKNQVNITVLNADQINKKSMGLLSAVGKGSKKEDGPMLLSITFKKSKSDFTLVGKGITFDTGGINLKPSSALKGMQYDMTGASVAVAIMYAFAALKLNPSFGIVVPLAENDISANCTKVGDIMKAYNGKTVEMTNSDAEGRLALADAVTYAIKDLKTKNVATIATLTGGVIIALGDIFSAYWATNEKQAKQIKDAAELSGEYVWQLPFHDSIKNRVIEKSAIADYINSDENRAAQSISGAEFIKLFAEDINFIHFDIAGTNEYKSKGKTQPLPILMYSLFNFIKDNYNGK